MQRRYSRIVVVSQLAPISKMILSNCSNLYKNSQTKHRKRTNEIRNILRFYNKHTMSCFNETFIVNKVEKLREMKTSGSSLVKTVGVGLTCGRCAMLYTDYKHLLEHLFWRHGTESVWCKLCGLKRWHYAPHVCHVLPINDGQIVDENHSTSDDSQYYSERESDYCFCGKYVEDSPMIGCDSPQCALQWYHFKCVGIEMPPEGDWICPKCTKVSKSRDLTKKKSVGIKT